MKCTTLVVFLCVPFGLVSTSDYGLILEEDYGIIPEEEITPEHEHDRREYNILPRHCADLKARGDDHNGLRTVFPYRESSSWPVEVHCDQTTEGGGWTIIQQRMDLPIRENFYRTWNEYVLGFGNLTGEFWLGLRVIHSLSSNTLTELRIDLQDYEEEWRFAKYGYFLVGDSESSYLLNIGEYSGSAGDAFVNLIDSKVLNGMKFSTWDNDNDLKKGNCARRNKGGWWYNRCHGVNLNGWPHKGQFIPEAQEANGITYSTWHGYFYSLKTVKMMVRPAFKNVVIMK